MTQPTPTTGLRDRIRRAVCEAEGFVWDSDMLEPDEYGEVADMVLAVRDQEMDRLRADLDTCRDRYATSASNAMTELAAKDAELVAARSTIDRVQGLADWLASHAGLGVDLEADGIRRGVADRLRDALGEQPADTAEHCTHYVDQHNRHHTGITVTGCPWCAGRDTKTETNHA